MPCAGQEVSNNLKQLLIDHASISFDDGRVFPFSQFSTEKREAILTNYVIEDIKASVCFVGKKPDSTEIIYDEQTQKITYRSSASEIGYPMEDRVLKILIPGWVRERAAEILFDVEKNEASVITLIIDAIKSVNIYIYIKFYIIYSLIIIKFDINICFCMLLGSNRFKKIINRKYIINWRN